MKKVLVFGITDNPGGVESVIMNYYRNIDRKKIQFDFLCNTEKVAYSEEIERLGGQIYKVTARSTNRKKFYQELEEFFKNHSNEYIAIWVNVCSLANIDYLKYAKKYNIKTRIIHAHNSQNMDSFLRGLLHRFNKIIISKYATDFWSCSEEASKWFYNYKIINSNEYKLINNAIDCDLYKYDSEVRKKCRKDLKLENKFIFSNIGRLHFQKNQEFIIKIFKEIHLVDKETVLLLIGDGPDKEYLKELVNKNGLNDSVIFLGIRKDIPQLLQATDILLFPSLFEGLPLVLVEAQASDVVIFTSENRIDDKVVLKEQNFNFISLDYDEKYWSKIIINKMKNMPKRNNNVKQIVEKGFDIKFEAKKLETFFENR